MNRQQLDRSDAKFCQMLEDRLRRGGEKRPALVDRRMNRRKALYMRFIDDRVGDRRIGMTCR